VRRPASESLAAECAATVPVSRGITNRGPGRALADSEGRADDASEPESRVITDHHPGDSEPESRAWSESPSHRSQYPSQSTHHKWPPRPPAALAALCGPGGHWQPAGPGPAASVTGTVRGARFGPPGPIRRARAAGTRASDGCQSRCRHWQCPGQRLRGSLSSECFGAGPGPRPATVPGLRKYSAGLGVTVTPSHCCHGHGASAAAEPGSVGGHGRRPGRYSGSVGIDQVSEPPLLSLGDSLAG
jgi:hypothetical protein